MRILVISITIAAIAWPLPALCNNLFLEGGTGFGESAHAQIVALRYQKDTSRLFDYPSYYEAFFASWNNDNHAQTLGFARGVNWSRREDHYFSTSAGFLVLNRTTEHLGTHLQFYFRLACDWKIGSRDFSFGFIHVSNGKLVFGWAGPNTGENFLTVSIGLF